MSESMGRRRRGATGVEPGDEVGGVPPGHHRRDHPGRCGPQVAGRRVHHHRHPSHGEGRRAGALAAKPGRPAKERDWALEGARAEIAQLTEAIKAQAIELAVVRGKNPAGARRPAPGESPRLCEGAGPQERR